MMSGAEIELFRGIRLTVNGHDQVFKNIRDIPDGVAMEISCPVFQKGGPHPQTPKADVIWI